MIGACIGLAALTLLLPSAPAYDSWSWILWGREVLDGDLRTVAGPSWKPLPVLFTAPFSLFGDAAPELWLVVARAGTFGAIVAAAILGARLAGNLGGVLAAASLSLSPWLWGAVWTGYSEGLVILTLLAAAERHLAGRHGQAFACGLACALLRPEAWPFLGLYALWLVTQDRSRLAWVVAGLALVPALWLLPELWGSGSLSRGADRALLPGPDAPARAARPWLAVLENSISILSNPVRLGLAVGVVAALLRQAPRVVVRCAAGMGAVAVGWVVIVAAMTEAGFSGINRYLAGPLAIAYVLAAVGFAWAISSLVGRADRSWWRLGGAAALCALGIAATLRTVVLDAPTIARSLDEEMVVSDQIDDVIALAGGEGRLKACGPVSASRLLGPTVAWELERHIEEVIRPRAPGSIMRARLFRHQPLDPPRRTADAQAGRIVARTSRWEIETTCSAP